MSAAKHGLQALQNPHGLQASVKLLFSLLSKSEAAVYDCNV